MFGLPQSYDRPRNVRLDTLVRLRWLAVFGQLAALLVVHFGLDYVVVPIWSCIAVIAVAALLNIALRVGFPHTLAPAETGHNFAGIQKCSAAPAWLEGHNVGV